ncbi:hypothetical protein PTSG_12709 [Salpingoeca rosetta]|uniref:Origin recognition complex subunit 5 n=1 Tax=Salpingoeca rosetta (strain ATCC 50818 / BSB-021) TaxID=946362 RepID=F2UJF0_SALR5|nr:uncharacterized protein PTSG_12709 [Salpingoeca rosetta]EGD77249.1 hypothetical protein PTSG_12709 [Salpingoeca rosetta]|eukprot:XP_004990593.1 hypothetical protein PTSG_12709 [Salpingoeca rosetta]
MSSSVRDGGGGEELVGREKELEQVRQYVGKPHSPCLPALFVYGTSATAKTTVVRTVMEESKCRYAMINCLETYSPRVLFEQILNSLSGDTPTPDNLYGGHARCDTVYKFIKYLKGVCDSQEDPKATVYIVLDNCERLRLFRNHDLAVFLRLRELVHRNVGVILISTVIWEKFREGTGFADPLMAHFPAYTKAETLAILQRRTPRDVHPSHFRQFVSLLWDVFHGPCRDLNELAHLVALFFDKYYAPVRAGKINADNKTALFKAISPLLRAHFSSLYLRETSTAEWLAAGAGGDGDKTESTAAPSSASTTSTRGASQLHKLELPYFAKVLILAAFLASHNPARSDLAIFSKRQRKLSKQRGRSKRKAARRADTTAKFRLPTSPSTFPLSRLFAIFYSLMDEETDLTADVYSHVKSLLSLRLLTRTTTDDNFDSAKFKCTMAAEDVIALGRSVEIDVVSYLHEVNA